MADLADAVAVLDLFGGDGTLAIGAVRGLTESDLELLENVESLGSVTPAVMKLRDSHHHIARMIAKGMKQVEIAAAIGYSQSRISILKKDPSFQELVAYYRGDEPVTYLGIQEKLAMVGTMALEELRDKIEEGELSPAALIRVAELTLDRSVAPPKNKMASGGVAGPLPNLSISFAQPQPAGLPTIELTAEDGDGNTQSLMIRQETQH